MTIGVYGHNRTQNRYCHYYRQRVASSVIYVPWSGPPLMLNQLKCRWFFDCLRCSGSNAILIEQNGGICHCHRPRSQSRHPRRPYPITTVQFARRVWVGCGLCYSLLAISQQPFSGCLHTRPISRQAWTQACGAQAYEQGDVHNHLSIWTAEPKKKEEASHRLRGDKS